MLSSKGLGKLLTGLLNTRRAADNPLSKYRLVYLFYDT